MPFVTEESYVQFCKGKRIVVVGPSAASSNIEQGKLIDQYDLIARIKSYWVPPEKRIYYGSRTDILYTDNAHTNDVLPGDKVIDKGSKREIVQSENNFSLRRNIITNHVKVVVSTVPSQEWFFNRQWPSMLDMSVYANVRIMPNEPYMSVRKQTNRPNAGFSAILDICSLPFSEIYITGIDFYRSLYKENYRNSLWTENTVQNMVSSPDGTTPDGKPDFHNPDLQFLYFKNFLYNKDKRIKVDTSLQNFLSDEKYEKLYR